MALVRLENSGFRFSTPNDFYAFCEKRQNETVAEMVKSGAFDRQGAIDMLGDPVNLWSDSKLYFTNDDLVEVLGREVWFGYPTHFHQWVFDTRKEAIEFGYGLAQKVGSRKNLSRQEITEISEKAV